MIGNDNYGTHKGKLNDIIKRGKICIMDIDVAGASRVIDDGLEANFIFIDSPGE